MALFLRLRRDAARCAPLALVFCATLFLGPVLSALGADGVDDILRQIKAESSGSAAAKPAPESAKPKPRPQGPVTKKKKQPKPSSTQPQQQTFSGPIWGPKDKLPKNIRGHGLAGNFVVAGTFDGCLLLEAEVDNLNPFCRRFVVANRQLDLPPYHYIPPEQRQVISIPRNRPLIFLEKTSLAYYYVHMH